MGGEVGDDGEEMNLANFIPVLITLHTVSGIPVEVNTELITHMRSPDKTNKAFVEGVKCMINMADGKFVTVRETCDSIRRAIRGEGQP